MKRIALVFMALALIAVPTVGAQSDRVATEREQIRDRIETKRTEREEALRARDAKKCEIVRVRLEAQFEKSDELFRVRSAKYHRILDRLNALVLRLENNDGDATELKEVVATTSDLVSETETTYGQYVAELREASNLACVDEVNFRDTLQTARSALRTARQDDREIRDYLREEVRTVIEAIIESNNSSGDTQQGDASEEEATNEAGGGN